MQGVPYFEEVLEVVRKHLAVPSGENFSQDRVAHIVGDNVGGFDAQLPPKSEGLFGLVVHGVDITLVENVIMSFNTSRTL